MRDSPRAGTAVAFAHDVATRIDTAHISQELTRMEIDERAIILASLEDPPEGLAELRAVLLNEHQWRRREGLDPVEPD